MPRQVPCPFCKGCGRIEGEAVPPPGMIPLPVLAARAGRSLRTLQSHRKQGLLVAEVGEYRVRRQWVVGWLVTKYRAKEYLAWLAGRTKFAHLDEDRRKAIESEEPPERVAARFGIKRASVLRARQRRRAAAVKVKELQG